MTALWILASLIALIALLLSFSAVLMVEIREDIRLYIGICGFRKRFGPGVEPKEKKEKPEKAKKKAKKKKNAELEQKAKKLETEPVAEKSLGDTVEFVLLLLRSIFPGAVSTLSHLRFTAVRIRMTVAGDEADEVAIRYGAVSAGVYNLLAVIDNACHLHVKWIELAPDFVTGEAVYDISFKVKLRLGRILFSGIGILCKFLVNTIRAKREKDVPVEPQRPAA